MGTQNEIAARLNLFRIGFLTHDSCEFMSRSYENERYDKADILKAVLEK